MTTGSHIPRSGLGRMRHTLTGILFLLAFSAAGAAVAQQDLRMWHRWWIETNQSGAAVVVLSLTLENNSGKNFDRPILGSSDAVFLLCAGEPLRIALATISNGAAVERMVTLPCNVNAEPLLWSQPLMFHVSDGDADVYVLSTPESSP